MIKRVSYSNKYSTALNGNRSDAACLIKIINPLSGNTRKLQVIFKRVTII